MGMTQRCGKWGVWVHDSSTGNKRWVGTYATRAEAKRAEDVAKTIRTNRGWGLRSKRESQCRNCGAGAEVLHHLVPRNLAPPNSDFDSPQFNGLPLCNSCHRGWHTRTLRIPREKLLIEEVAFVAGSVGLDWLEANYPSRGGRIDINQQLAEEVVVLRIEIENLRRERDARVNGEFMRDGPDSANSGLLSERRDRSKS